MEKESGYKPEEQFETAIDGLSFDALKALHAVQVRDGIIDRDGFRHIANMTSAELDEALVEITRLGLVEENEGVWSMTPPFREYWEKNTKKE